MYTETKKKHVNYEQTSCNITQQRLHDHDFCITLFKSLAYPVRNDHQIDIESMQFTSIRRQFDVDSIDLFSLDMIVFIKIK